MAENIRAILIGKMIVSRNPEDVLVVYGLGSCVAVCMYDPVLHSGGMMHALLPTAVDGTARPDGPAKFVDEGISRLLEEMRDMGSKRYRLRIYLCGGAQMLSDPGFENVLNIGERNTAMARQTLRAMNLEVRAEATGGHIGRTIKLYIGTGLVTIKTMLQDEYPMEGSYSSLHNLGGQHGQNTHRR